jgi:hypothetical protein
MKVAFLAATLLLALASPMRASAASFVVRGDTRIGTFAVKADGTLSGAIRAFGEPDTIRGQGESCTAAWPSYGLTIHFYNLGGQNACTPQFGYFSRAFMRGRRWRTASGLRIGAPARSIRRYHPRATWHPGLRYGWPPGWWLVTRTSPYGSGDSRYPGLLAETRDARVFGFQVRYPAGGD